MFIIDYSTVKAILLKSRLFRLKSYWPYVNWLKCNQNFNANIHSMYVISSLYELVGILSIYVHQKLQTAKVIYFLTFLGKLSSCNFISVVHNLKMCILLMHFVTNYKLKSFDTFFLQISLIEILMYEKKNIKAIVCANQN